MFFNGNNENNCFCLRECEKTLENVEQKLGAEGQVGGRVSPDS